MLYIVAAISDNHVIGVNGKLPWRLKNELKWFRANTTGGAVIMGRKTWDSLPKKPLPNRLNIILTRNPMHKDRPNVIWKNSMLDAIRCARQRTKNVYIIGGTKTFETAQQYPCAYLITRVHCTIPEQDQICKYILPGKKKLIWRSKKHEENDLTYHHELYIT